MAEEQSSTANKDICLTYFVLDSFRNKESNLTALLKPNTCRLSLPATEESVQTTFNASNKPASIPPVQLLYPAIQEIYITQNNYWSMAVLLI